MSPFEKFIQQDQGRYCIMPTITLVVGEVKVHSARFNAAACRQFELSEWRNVELYYDRERRAVGLARVSSPTAASRRLCISARRRMATVSCKAFLHHVGITETIRLPVELDEETGYLVAILPVLENEKEKP